MSARNTKLNATHWRISLFLFDSNDLLTHDIGQKESQESLFHSFHSVVGPLFCSLDLDSSLLLSSRFSYHCQLARLQRLASITLIFLRSLISLFVVDGHTVPWWAQAIRYLVQIFPVFTVSTAFPLNASALGNTLVTIAPTSWRERFVFNSDLLTASLKLFIPSHHLRWGESKLKIICRLVTIIPPFIAGTFDSKASEIVQYPGETIA